MPFIGIYQEHFYLAIVAQEQETKRVYYQADQLLDFCTDSGICRSSLRTRWYPIVFECEWSKSKHA